jgi:ribosomal protein S27E
MSTYHWEDDAACQGMPDAMFFGVPDRYGVDRHDDNLLLQARDTCGRCIVREECLAKALKLGAEAYGVWGGTTEEERERLNRKIVRVKCPVCASTVLHDQPGAQICCACGHSWATRRGNAQTRDDTEVA